MNHASPSSRQVFRWMGAYARIPPKKLRKCRAYFRERVSLVFVALTVALPFGEVIPSRAHLNHRRFYAGCPVRSSW